MRQFFLLFGLCTLSFTAEGQGNLSLVGPVRYNSNIAFPINLLSFQFDTIVIPQNHVLKIEQSTLAEFAPFTNGSYPHEWFFRHSMHGLLFTLS
jgi:hypothetical protein